MGWFSRKSSSETNNVSQVSQGNQLHSSAIEKLFGFLLSFKDDVNLFADQPQQAIQSSQCAFTISNVHTLQQRLLSAKMTGSFYQVLHSLVSREFELYHRNKHFGTSNLVKEITEHGKLKKCKTLRAEDIRNWVGQIFEFLDKSCKQSQSLSYKSTYKFAYRLFCELNELQLTIPSSKERSYKMKGAYFLSRLNQCLSEVKKYYDARNKFSSNHQLEQICCSIGNAIELKEMHLKDFVRLFDLVIKFVVDARKNKSMSTHSTYKAAEKLVYLLFFDVSAKANPITSKQVALKNTKDNDVKVAFERMDRFLTAMQWIERYLNACYNQMQDRAQQKKMTRYETVYLYAWQLKVSLYIALLLPAESINISQPDRWESTSQNSMPVHLDYVSILCQLLSCELANKDCADNFLYSHANRCDVKRNNMPVGQVDSNLMYGLINMVKGGTFFYLLMRLACYSPYHSLRHTLCERPYQEARCSFDIYGRDTVGFVEEFFLLYPADSTKFCSHGGMQEHFLEKHGHLLDCCKRYENIYHVDPSISGNTRENDTVSTNVLLCDLFEADTCFDNGYSQVGSNIFRVLYAQQSFSLNQSFLYVADHLIPKKVNNYIWQLKERLYDQDKVLEEKFWVQLRESCEIKDEITELLKIESNFNIELTDFSKAKPSDHERYQASLSVIIEEYTKAYASFNRLVSRYARQLQSDVSLDNRNINIYQKIFDCQWQGTVQKLEAASRNGFIINHNHEGKFWDQNSLKEKLGITLLSELIERKDRQEAQLKESVKYQAATLRKELLQTKTIRGETVSPIMKPWSYPLLVPFNRELNVKEAERQDLQCSPFGGALAWNTVLSARKLGIINTVFINLYGYCLERGDVKRCFSPEAQSAICFVPLRVVSSNISRWLRHFSQLKRDVIEVDSSECQHQRKKVLNLLQKWIEFLVKVGDLSALNEVPMLNRFHVQVRDSSASRYIKTIISEIKRFKDAFKQNSDALDCEVIDYELARLLPTPCWSLLLCIQKNSKLYKALDRLKSCIDRDGASYTGGDLLCRINKQFIACARRGDSLNAGEIYSKMPKLLSSNKLRLFDDILKDVHPAIRSEKLYAVLEKLLGSWIPLPAFNKPDLCQMVKNNKFGFYVDVENDSVDTLKSSSSKSVKSVKSNEVGGGLGNANFILLCYVVFLEKYIKECYRSQKDLGSLGCGQLECT